MSGKEQGDGTERLAVFMGEFPAVVGADGRWLCAFSLPLLFFPVCWMHDESLVAFVRISILALETSPRSHPRS